MGVRNRNHYHPASFYGQQNPYPPQMPYVPTQPTPYELYAKPPQPLDLLDGGQQPHTATPPQTGLLGAFTDGNGQVDFDKAITAINQLASTYHQVSPIVKQFSSFLKMMR